MPMLRSIDSRMIANASSITSAERSFFELRPAQLGRPLPQLLIGHGLDLGLQLGHPRYDRAVTLEQPLVAAAENHRQNSANSQRGHGDLGRLQMDGSAVGWKTRHGRSRQPCPIDGEGR